VLYCVVLQHVASLDESQLTIEFAINKSKALNILHVFKLTSYLLICFTHANKPFIHSTIGRIYDRCHPLFAQHSTSHTLDPFSLFLSPTFTHLCISPALFHIKYFDLSICFIIEYMHFNER
jgi:hypothetical protein